MVGRSTTDLKVSIGEGLNPVIDDFHKSVAGIILKFFEKNSKSNNALGMEYNF